MKVYWFNFLIKKAVFKMIYKKSDCDNISCSIPSSEGSPFFVLKEYVFKRNKKLCKKLIKNRDGILLTNDLLELKDYLRDLIIYLINNPNLDDRKMIENLYKRNSFFNLRKRKEIIFGIECYIYEDLISERKILWLHKFYELVEKALNSKENLYIKNFKSDEPIKCPEE